MQPSPRGAVLQPYVGPEIDRSAACAVLALRVAETHSLLAYPGPGLMAVQVERSSHLACSERLLLSEEFTSGPFTTQYEPASSPAEVAVTDCCPLPEPYATSWLCRWWFVPMCCSLITVPQVTCAGRWPRVIRGWNLSRGWLGGVNTVKLADMVVAQHGFCNSASHHSVVVRHGDRHTIEGRAYDCEETQCQARPHLRRQASNPVGVHVDRTEC